MRVRLPRIRQVGPQDSISSTRQDVQSQFGKVEMATAIFFRYIVQEDQKRVAALLACGRSESREHRYS